MNETFAPYTVLYRQLFRETDKLADWFSAGEHRLGHEGARRWDTEIPRTRNLRLDSETEENLSYEERVRLALRLAAQDFYEMVIYGDEFGKANDALLKTMDGDIKLREQGYYISNINISSAQLHEQHKPKQGKYEYTLYLVVNREAKEK